ncbi:Protein YobA [Paraburkholderia domus]|uniref:copper resistance CopC family protein n=1 Tax=Paraburkholderia domus TaxID=2793075 RepID=UPI00191242A0|nr:copper resistance protein CopC [Paraburkholderia domus]MBK5054309.1 copper resistance protein CopC [Burkholderia sp. R-70006]MBK5064506.1 copper resistance protein CopC [Burkholderia sp. R-70199]MBK5091330.1 copper resistance protein CopC [Burkholderia sp. R-69927]CAE6858059.1 Protein YobA [Paraburkholderia domus]CAE6933553.1 Protein YobA [Paraburkholderia domus]
MNHDRQGWMRTAAKLPMLIAGLAFASVAFAHVFPQKQVPGAGATVASPAQVRIVFDGPLEPAFSSLTVTDASGKQVNTEKAVVDAHEAAAIAVPLPALTAGHYTVHWVAVASDGHRTHGDYAFDVK